MVNCIFNYAWILSIHTKLWLLQGFIHSIRIFNIYFLLSVLLCFFWISRLLFEFCLCTALCWLHGLLLLVPLIRLSFSLFPIMIHLFQPYPKWAMSALSLGFLIISVIDLWTNTSLDKHDLGKQATYPTEPTSMVNRWTFQPALIQSFANP